MSALLKRCAQIATEVQELFSYFVSLDLNGFAFNPYKNFNFNMNVTNFQNWRLEHPYLENDFFYLEGNNCKWGRIDARWKEKKGKIQLTHHCAYVINLHNGDIYVDYSKHKIWLKCLLMLIGRPVLGIVKTTYYLCATFYLPVCIFKIVMAGIQQDDSKKKISRAVFQKVKYSLVDIVRTPVYTTALIIITLGAVLIVPFISCKLYDCRALIGRLEKALNRNKENAFTLAPCCQPLDNLQNIHNENYSKDDTDYENQPTLHGLNNLARKNIRYMIKTPLTRYCRKLNRADKPYISAAYSQQQKRSFK